MLWLSLLACTPRQAENGHRWYLEGSPEATVPAEDPPAPSPLQNFSWVEPDALAAMAYPRDLDAVAASGVHTLVSLTEVPPDQALVEAAGLNHVHLPIRDFTAPTLDQMLAFVSLVQQGQDAGAPVGVHCLAGLGRSGTMGAAWFVAQGMTAEDALVRIRQVRPGSVETPAQEQALHDLEAALSQ